MEELMAYVKPELMIVTAALYFLGSGIKKSEIIKNKYIPLILGAAGIAICSVYVFATCNCSTWSNIAQAVFTSITQGLIVAGLSTYINQILKQRSKIE